MNDTSVRILIAVHLARQLEDAGFELCDPVTNGNAAVRTAELERPDVVLLDVRLAETKGREETGLNAVTGGRVVPRTNDRTRFASQQRSQSCCALLGRERRA